MEEERKVRDGVRFRQETFMQVFICGNAVQNASLPTSEKDAAPISPYEGGRVAVEPPGSRGFLKAKRQPL